LLACPRPGVGGPKKALKRGGGWFEEKEVVSATKSPKARGFHGPPQKTGNGRKLMLGKGEDGGKYKGNLWSGGGSKERGLARQGP